MKPSTIITFLTGFFALSFVVLLAGAQTITTVDAGSGGDVGQHASQAVVAGNPAVAYYDATAHRLRFARNSAADGAGAWTISNADGSGDLTDFPANDVGWYTSLAVVNGTPAISYFDKLNKDLKFARNSAADGSGVWTVATVDSAGDVGRSTSLAVVNGDPAVSYYDATNGNLKFARNAATDGSGAWTIITVDNNANDVGLYTSLTVLSSGNPAISYYDATAADLKFVRAQDTDGATWFTPVTVDSTGVVGEYTSLVTLVTSTFDNAPAIAYFDRTNGNLKFARNSLTDGSGTWTPVTVDTGGTNMVGTFASLTTIGTATNRTPMISYYDETSHDLKFARNSQTNANGTWTTITVDTAGDVGEYASVKQVNGTPAVCYYDVTNGNLKFARSNLATDPPTAWTWGVARADSGFQSGITGLYTSQAIVNGNPAIGYFDFTNGDLKFARNSAADGSGVWAINTLDSTGNVGWFASLAVVNGNPAISYLDSTNGDLKYARAANANGTGAWTLVTLGTAGHHDGFATSLAVMNTIPPTPAISYLDDLNDSFVLAQLGLARTTSSDGAAGTWTTSTAPDPQTFGFPQAGASSSLAVVNGKPAIGYYHFSNLVFARAANSDGTGAWTKIAVDSTGDVGRGVSLAVVTGNPSMSYYDVTANTLKFARAPNADGTGTWSISTVNSTGGPGGSSSLKIWNGLPCISYYGTGALKFAVNAAADGSGAWTSFALDSADAGRFSSLAILANGKPAISYTDDKRGLLKWIVLDFPEIAVLEQPAGTEISDGGSRSVTLAIGSLQDLNFTVRNLGLTNLTGLTVTKDGPHASDFTVTVSPVAPVSGPFGGTPLTVRFNPTTAGTKTAAIHIASNDADESSYDINFTGTVLSFTQDTDLDGLNDAAEFQMAALGFDWQMSQPALVNTLFSNLNGALQNLNDAGFYSQSQIQALYVGTPLLTRNPGNGQFKLTIGIRKSTDLLNFSPFPFTAPATTINGQGQIEFQFSVPDNAAFFRLQAQ